MNTLQTLRSKYNTCARYECQGTLRSKALDIRSRCVKLPLQSLGEFILGRKGSDN